MATKLGCVLLVLSFLGIAEGVRVRSCSKGRNPNDELATVSFLDVRPDPVQVPGDLSIALTVTMNKPIKGVMDADLTISRKFGPFWIDLPCVNTRLGRLGSCEYRDICATAMNNRSTSPCPKLLADNKIPCRCDVPVGKYVIPTTIIPLTPAKFGITLPTVQGEYQAILRVKDRVSMKEVYCLNVNVQLTDGPTTSGGFGNIGRFFTNLFG